MSLKKITSDVKFAERKSALLQNNNVWKEILPFVQSYKVTPPLHHPKNNFMSKWHLIQPLRRKIYKKPMLISYVLVWSKNLWSRITLYGSLYVCVWFVNTLTSTAPIGSPIICMWSPAEIWEQWERNLSFSSADDRGAGTHDEPLRTSAWELWFKLICTHVVVINIKYLFCQAHGFLKVQAQAYTTLFTTG